MDDMQQEITENIPSHFILAAKPPDFAKCINISYCDKMTTKVVSPEEWRKARIELLEREKAHTRRTDELTALRANLPMTKIEKDYECQCPNGRLSLEEMFQGKRQLIIYHVMFDPAWDVPHKSCAFVVDELPTHMGEIKERDTTIALVSRAPLEKLTAFQQRMRWKIPWYSSLNSDFNYDFHVTLDAAVAPVEYNYQQKPHMSGEKTGMSVFFRGEDGEIYHTYSCYSGSLGPLLVTYTLLDMTPLGRQDKRPHPPGGDKFHDDH